MLSKLAEQVLQRNVAPTMLDVVFAFSAVVVVSLMEILVDAWLLSCENEFWLYVSGQWLNEFRLIVRHPFLEKLRLRPKDSSPNEEGREDRLTIRGKPVV